MNIIYYIITLVLIAFLAFITDLKIDNLHKEKHVSESQFTILITESSKVIDELRKEIRCIKEVISEN